MIASLPMYLRPETRAAHDAFWTLIRDALRARGVEAPDALSLDAPILETWGRPDLVLGQICNFPYRTAFADRVTLIGAGDYGLPDTPPGHYHSVFIARRDDPRMTLTDFDGAPFAYNSADSQSGWAAPRLYAEAEGLTFGPLTATGGHRESARAVAQGAADLAGIDAVTWRIITRHDPFAADLKVVARTPHSPGLSFITAGEVDPAPYRAAMTEALGALPAPHRADIALQDVVPLPRSAYLSLPNPPPPMPSP